MNDNEVTIPLKAQEKLRASIGQLQQMQQSINTYFQGVCDSLGLEGGWNLDAKRMVAVRRQEPAPIATQTDEEEKGGK